MKRFVHTLLLILCSALLLPGGSVFSQSNAPNYKYGLFEDARDVGAVKLPGSVEYDAAKKSYTITGGGENMWATTDAFHFVWRRLSGDLSIAADISLIGT